ncbi:flagellar basal-body MS-ring/collar protein FliF [Nocardioides dongkuii]|uniref:flagellar basal-body MS-ring/collar protein FliF n=1 Tax=Nocardioides dongkuii TaxID=2760089 RepID=UPI0015FD819A|nr:flagellar basal-body MS-ring/collar protein FliF [Nocardioides dongkuii]
MKDTITRLTGKLRQSFAAFTTGQKVVAVLGTLALLLGGFMVFRWASTPSYAPLFSNLSSTDASAVVEQLESQGVPYEIAGGGGTVMVPRDQVYETRIELSGEGLPTSSEGGYSLLDDQGLSTSEDQWQTDFKRAMEGELSTTIEGIDDVQTAVVHLALPEKEVFADEQEPSTASVLLQTSPGNSLESSQVQAVVHLVASSIDGMDPENVTVADSTGRVLTAPDSAGGGAAATTRNEQVKAVQDELNGRLQRMLDQVVGAGNSTVQVTVDLDFDKTVTETTEYDEEGNAVPFSTATSTESYNGVDGAPGAAGGVVGPDGQTEETGAAATDGSYEKEQVTQDNAVGSRVERRETAPGAIESQHVGVVLDGEAAGNVDPNEIRGLVAATIGIDKARGDTVKVSSLPFNRSAEDAAAAELEAAAKADAASARMDLIRKAGLAVLVLLLLLLAWVTARRRNKARQEATSYLVEQLRADQARNTAALETTTPAALALEQAELDEAGQMRHELNALIERQPEDVAELLRGWLVERPS